MQTKNGTLEVVCGSMFSGKSEELLRRLRRATIARQQVLAFKPNIAVLKHKHERQQEAQQVGSRNGGAIDAYNCEKPEEIISMALEHQATTIGIDEAQFFQSDLVPAVCTLVEQGIRVIIAGLDLDFRGVPFGPMPALMALADTVTKLQAICTTCAASAHFTQRLIDGKPACVTDPVVVVNAKEVYEARCRSCYQLGQE